MNVSYGEGRCPETEERLFLESRAFLEVVDSTVVGWYSLGCSFELIVERELRVVGLCMDPNDTLSN